MIPRFTNLKNAIELLNCNPNLIPSFTKYWDHKETFPVIESVMASLHNFVHD